MGSGNTCENAVKSWYDEVQYYNYSCPGFCANTGHFTQLVWKSSQRVGVGIAKSSRTGMTVVVANYYPAGNMMGQFPSNVLPR
ncbi:unnamed protein product [Enterobius vermicularis]|uniref:SCP domain-containing protein n=1 Tax=Enterobius vermicularis TaxID=51028 RepID=A0A0N4UTA7_ENTVE|nr:unnamed protein product [Enterobius vermicularis]